MPSKKTGPSKVKKDDRTSQTPRGTTQTNKNDSSGSSSGSKPQSTSSKQQTPSSSGSAKQNVSLPTATQNLRNTTAQSILNNAAASAVKQDETVRTGINMAPPTNGRGFSDGRLSGTSAMTGKNTLSYTDSKGDKHTATAGGLGTMNPLEALQAAAYMRNSTNQTASELRNTASRMDDNSAGRQKLMDTAGFIRNLSQYDQKLPDEQRSTIVRMKNEWNEAQDYIGKLEQYKAQYAEYGLDTSEIDRAIEQAKAFQRQRHDIADLNRSYSGYTGGLSGDRFDKWNLSQEYTDVSSDNAHWSDTERAAAGNDTFDIDLYKQGGTDRYKWVDPTWELKEGMANEEAYSEQLRRMGDGYGADIYKKDVADTAVQQANPSSWDERVENMVSSAGNRVGGSLLSFGSLAAQAAENTIANSRGRYADLKAQQNEARRRLRNAQNSGNEAEIKKWQAEIDRYEKLMYGVPIYNEAGDAINQEWRDIPVKAYADDPGTSKKGHDMLEKSREQLMLAKRGLGGYGQFAMETAGVGLENIPTMALYALNPVAGAAYMAATVLGEKGDEFSRDEFGNVEYSAQEALLKAAPYAAVETASEAIGDSAILGFINKRGSLGLGGIAARSFLTEGAEEGAAGILDYGLDYWYGNPEVRSYTAGKVLGDAAKEALQGGIIGGIMGAGGAVLANSVGSSQENIDPDWWKNVDTSPVQNYTDRFRTNRMMPGNADYIEMMKHLQEQAGRRNAETLGSSYTEEAPVRYDPRTWGQDMNILVDMYREGGITDKEWREIAYDDDLVSMIEDTAERKMAPGSRVAWIQKTIGDLANIQAEYNNGRTIERSGRYAPVRNASNESMDAAGDVLRNATTGKKGGIRKNGKADELISKVRGVLDVSDIENRASALAETESTEKGASIVSMVDRAEKPASLRMEEENEVSDPVDIRRMVKPVKADESSVDGDIIDYEYTDADVPAENEGDTRTADDMAEDTYEGMSDEEIADVINLTRREQIDAGDPAVDEIENAEDIIRNALPEMDETTENEVMNIISGMEAEAQRDGIPWSRTDIEKLAKRVYDDIVRNRENESKETQSVSEKQEKSSEGSARASLESAIRAAHEGITDEQISEVMGYVSEDMLNRKPTEDIVKMLEPGINGVMAAAKMETESVLETHEENKEPEAEEQEPVKKVKKPGPFMEQTERLVPQFIGRHFKSMSTSVREAISGIYEEVLYEYDDMLKKGVAKWETIEKRLGDISREISKIQKSETNDPRIQAIHKYMRDNFLSLTESDMKDFADLDEIRSTYRDSKRLRIREADYTRDSSGNKVYKTGISTDKKGGRTPNLDTYWEELVQGFNDIPVVSRYAALVEKNQAGRIEAIIAINDAVWSAKDNYVSADTILSSLVEDYVSSSAYIEKFGDRYGYQDNDELPFDKVSENPKKPKQKKQPKVENKQKEPEQQNGPGLVVDDYVSANVSRAEQKRLDESAKALGITVRFADEVNGGESNAQYENGVVTIEKNNPNPTLFLYGHEITHHLEDTAPDAHKRLKNYLKNQSDYRKRLADMKELYSSRGYQVTDDYIENEVVADMTGDLINNEDILRKFIKANRKNQTFLQKLFSAFRSLMAKLGGTGRSRDVAKACGLIEDAIDASVEARFKSNGGVRNSIKMESVPGQQMTQADSYSGDMPMMAVRGTTIENLTQALEDGCFVTPSIAVGPATNKFLPEESYGRNLVFFGRNAVDPAADAMNVLFRQDAYTQLTPSKSVLEERGVEYSPEKALSYARENGYTDEKGNSVYAPYEYAATRGIPTFKSIDQARESAKYAFDSILNRSDIDSYTDQAGEAMRQRSNLYYMMSENGMDSDAISRFMNALSFANPSEEIVRSVFKNKGLPDSAVSTWKKYMDASLKSGSRYFEAKPDMLVPFYKVSAVVLDKNGGELAETAKSKLESYGIPYFEYDSSGSPEEKISAVDSAISQNGTRFSLKTSQYKQWGVTDREVTRNPDNTHTGKTITEIVDWVQTQMGVQVTTGQMRGNPKTVRGYYRPSDQAIRTRINNNLPTITHELGHWLDDMTSRKTGGKVGDFSNSLSEEARKELVENTDVVKRYQNEGERVHVSEGFAEFIREFLKSKASAQAKFPTVYKELYNSLDARQMQQIDYLADMVNDYMTSPADLGNAIRRRNDRVDTRTKKQQMEDKAHRLYQTWVDSNHAIEILTRETGDRSPYIAATNAAYAAHRAGAIITRNMYSLDGTELVGPSLKHALEGAGMNMKDEKSAKQEYDDFGTYLVAKHGPERIKKGIDRSGKGRVTADDRMNDIAFLEKTAAELEEKYPHFKDAAEALYQFQKDFLYEYAVGSGIISKKTADEWQDMWDHYVPFQRYMADGKGTDSSASRGFANQVSGIYRFKGSGRDIIHPVDSVIGFVTRMTTVAVMNDVMRQLTDSVVRNGLEARWMERVQTPEDVVKVSTESFKKKVMKFINGQIDFESWEEDEIQEFEDGLMALDDEISKYMQGDPHGNVVSVYKNGKAEFWKVNDKLLLESLTSLQPKTLDGTLAMAATVTRFMTSNITGRNVVWSVMSNMPRDIVTALVFSKNHNPAEIIGGMLRNYGNFLAGEKSNNQFFDEFIAMGGGQVTSWNADIDNSANIQRQMGWLTDYSTADTSVLQKGGRKVKGVGVGFIAALDQISAAVESGPRFAEYESLRKQGVSPQDAFYAAMDVTTNFARHGKMSQGVNYLVPFFNASVQGIDKFSRWIRATDVEGSKADRQKASVGRALVWAGASMLIAAMIYGFNNRDDDNKKYYQMLSNYTKNNYFCISLGDGNFRTIPKPREIAVLESFFESAMEYAHGGNKDAFKDFYDYATEQLTPPAVSPVLQGIDVNAFLSDFGMFGALSAINGNKDFLGNPIESRSFESSNTPINERMNSKTSVMAKWFADIVAASNLPSGIKENASPLKIDYFMKQVLGGFWKTPANIFPIGDEYKQENKAAFIASGLGRALLGNYTKDALYSNDLVNWMYDYKTEQARAGNADTGDFDADFNSKLAERYTDFYGRFYGLTKNASNSDEVRQLRKSVLDTMIQFKKQAESDMFPAYIEQLRQVAQDQSDKKVGDLLPQVFDKEIKDANGEKHLLTGSQYYELQTRYNGYYAEAVQQILANDEASANEKTAAIDSMKDDIAARARKEVLEMIGAPTSATKTSAAGNESTTYIDKFAQYYESGKISSGEMAGLRMTVNAQKSNYLPDHSTQDLSESFHKAKAIADYGLDLSVDETAELMRTFGINSEKVIAIYKEGTLDETVKAIDDGCAEVWAYYNASTGGN